MNRVDTVEYRGRARRTRRRVLLRGEARDRVFSRTCCMRARAHALRKRDSSLTQRARVTLNETGRDETSSSRRRLMSLSSSSVARIPSVELIAGIRN